MTQMIFLEDLQEAGGIYTPPAAKRGYIMMWNDGLLRLTRREQEQANYPMVRWSMPRESSVSEKASNT